MSDRVSQEPLAIVGMACRFPGAENLDQFWELIQSGRSAIGELPADRLNRQLYYAPEKGTLGKTYSTLGGIVPERPFDQPDIRLSDEVIAAADVAHLTMLDVAAKALRHSKQKPGNDVRNTGVYIGHARGSPVAGDVAYALHAEDLVDRLQGVEEFQRLPQELRKSVSEHIVERIHRSRPNRTHIRSLNSGAQGIASFVARGLGFNGPCMAVDAACASSLVGLAKAAWALRHGRIDMAIVGGASYSSWFSLVLFSQAQALSSQGSFPFDTRADGFISSDGYAAIVLKTLSRAVADGDSIHAVVRGIGISSDGRGKSLWAPRKEGQIEAIQRAYVDGGDPNRLQYVEAHGTSTRLGDATEVEALREAIGPHLAPGIRIPISSVKANIGHTRESAGLAGLIKTVLAISHKKIPVATNFQNPNPDIPWEKLPFFVPTSEQDWPVPADNGPRCAAVDAFGIGGLNVHVCLEEPPSLNPIPSTSRQNGGINGSLNAKKNVDAAIVGLGAIFPGARTAEDFWDLLKTGRDPKSRAQTQRWNADVFRKFATDENQTRVTPLGGFVTDFNYDWKKNKVPPRSIETADPLQFMLLDAAEQALNKNGIDKLIERRRTAVVVGTMFGGDFANQLNIGLRLPEFLHTLQDSLRSLGIDEQQTIQITTSARTHLEQCYSAIYDETGSYTSSTLASRISKTLDLMGGAFSVDAEGTSSFAAIAAAIDLLQSGACDTVVCASGSRMMDAIAYSQFSMRGLLAQDHPSPGFDSAASGCVPGEGAGVIILKRFEDAQQAGHKIHGVIRGIGASMNTDTLEVSLQQSIERSWAASGIDPKDVSHVEATGLGVASVDTQEARALAATYGPHRVRSPLPVGTLAAQIGYTQGAAGMASLLKTTLALENKSIPANFAWKAATAELHSVTALKAVTSPINLNGLHRTKPVKAGVSAISTSGLTWHLILERPATASSDEIVPVTSRIVRMGAASIEDLRHIASQSVDRASSLFAGASLSRFSATDTVRLVIVADSQEDLAQKLKLAGSQIGDKSTQVPLEEQGIYWKEPNLQKPRVAMIFSGQGSQYDGMLVDLVQQSPAAGKALDEINATLSRLNYPSFDELAWNEENDLGCDVWRTQLSVLLADLIVYASVVEMGIRPDVVCGHSFGEYAALVAAGVWSLEQALRIVKVRATAIDQLVDPNGRMLATSATPSELLTILAEVSDEVWIANENAPDQTVIGGSGSAIEQILLRLKEAGFNTTVLSVPGAYHTPMMNPVKEPLRQALQHEQLLPPKVLLLSSITNCYVAEPGEIANNLVEQLSATVRYVELVQRLANDGATLLIEVGPRQVLTRLNRRCISDPHVTTVASDNPKRPGVRQLQCVLAAAQCAGLESETPIQSRNTAHSQSTRTLGQRNVSLSEIVHYDATERRREKNRRSSESKLPPVVSSIEPDSLPATTANADDLEAFLVRFVCEQTGYPPEIVALDADMEADLGLDSIKKAQLFGELREQFNLQPVANLSLSDFPTLRHVLEFLRQQSGSIQLPNAQASDDAAVESDRPTASSTPLLQPSRPTETSSTATIVQTVARPKAKTKSVASESDSVDAILNSTRLFGTPYEMGLQHAQAHADSIRTVLNRYVDLLGPRIEKIGELYQALATPDQYLDPDGVEELKGLADGLRVPTDYLLAYNLGLYPADVPGCLQYAVPTRFNGSNGLIHATNEDWVLALVLPNCLRRMVQIRHPKGDKIPHVLFGACGQLGGINGINARGIGITSTLLLDRPWRDAPAAGKLHTVVVRQILEQATNLDEAVELAHSIEKSWAWSMCISDSHHDEVCYLEYDRQSLIVERNKDRVLSTNHCLLHDHLSEPPSHSLFRMQRLESLLGDETAADRTTEQVKSALRDQFDLGRGRVTPHPTMNTVRRVDNQASIVMRPANEEVWITSGPLSGALIDQYFRIDLKTAFQAPTSAIPSSPHAAKGSCEEADETDARSERFVLRMHDSPRPAESRPLTGNVLLLGNNATATALRDRLCANGNNVIELKITQDLQDTIDHLNQVWMEAPAQTLMLVTSRDEDASEIDEEADWLTRRNRGLILPFKVCQRWTELVSEVEFETSPLLTAVTALGGDFGFSGHVTAVDGGGLAGLLKAIRQEFPELIVKVIDTPPEESPTTCAANVLAEVMSVASDCEVGYSRGVRRVVRAIPRPAVPCGREIRRGGNWVVTGGARGITAAIVQELGQRYQLNLHLIGRSQIEQIQDEWRGLTAEKLKQLKMSFAIQARSAGRDPTLAWRELERAIETDNNLQKLKEAGVRATYHSCDVANRSALASVLQQIRTTDGPIQGVIHAAGIEAAARFDRKTMDSVEATLSSKVDGAAALIDLLRDDPVDFLIAFGSVSGRFGGHGQSDYSMASDQLAKLVSRMRAARPSCAACTIHWPAWDQIGMAVRPETRVVLESAGTRFLPPREGISHLIAELEAGAPEPEVLINSHPNPLDRDEIIPSLSRRKAFRTTDETISRSPLIEGLLEFEQNQFLRAEVRMNPSGDPFLAEHQLHGVPILPVVVSMEMLVEAASILAPDAVIGGLRDVEVVNGFRFFADRPLEAFVTATRTPEGISCELRGDFRQRDGRLIDPGRLYVKGIVEIGPRIEGERLPEDELNKSGSWHTMEYVDLETAMSRGRIYIGPPLQCLKELSFEQTGCWGRITAPEPLELAGPRPGDLWNLPSAVLDCCLQCAGSYLYLAHQTIQLPQALKRLRLGRNPRVGELCTVRAKIRSRGEQHIRLDLALVGEDAETIARIDDFRYVVVTRRNQETGA